MVERRMISTSRSLPTVVQATVYKPRMFLRVSSQLLQLPHAAALARLVLVILSWTRTCNDKSANCHEHLHTCAKWQSEAEVYCVGGVPTFFVAVLVCVALVL